MSLIGVSLLLFQTVFTSRLTGQIDFIINNVLNNYHV